jgi:hypothetical protein
MEILAGILEIGEINIDDPIPDRFYLVAVHGTGYDPLVYKTITGTSRR